VIHNRVFPFDLRKLHTKQHIRLFCFAGNLLLGQLVRDKLVWICSDGKNKD